MHDAIDRFREAIRAALGYAPEVIEPGKLHRFATRERRGNCDGWCKLFDDMRGGVFGCHRQVISKRWIASDRREVTPAERAALARATEQVREREQRQREQWAFNAKRNASLWAQCVPVTDADPVHRYLCRRLALNVFSAPPCLRLHPELDYWQDRDKLGTFAAMLAKVIAPDGRVVALHRTFLTNDGRKAGVPTVKKLTSAAGPLGGASIRLQQPVRGTIGVAEGIETAMAASLASGVPTVAAYCAGALARLSQLAAVAKAKSLI